MSLKVQVSQARNLTRREKEVAPDTYCLLIFERQKEKTTVAFGSPQPFWDETFNFEIQSPSSAPPLEIEVYDKDLFGSEFLGKVSIPLFEAMGQPRWYPLKDRGKRDPRVGGEIRLIVATQGFNESQRKALLEGGKKQSATDTGGGGGGSKGYSRWDDNDRVPEQERQTRQNINEAEELAKDQRDATRRMLSKLNDTQSTASGTLSTLQEQGEQIKRIQTGVDRVNDHADEAHDNIKQVDSFWYSVKTHFKKNKKKQSRDTNAKMDDSIGRANADTSGGKKVDKGYGNQGSEAKQHQHPKELGILSKEAQYDVQEADQNLDQMKGALDNLKRMAQQMGTEVDGQNERIDQISVGMNEANIKIQKDTKKIDKMIKK